MKIKIAIMCSTVVFSSPLLAGSSDSQTGLTDAGNPLFTINNLLNDGTAGSKCTGTFVAWSRDPNAGTGDNNNNTAGKTPVINVNSATSVQILQGTFFWGLQQGTATAGDNVTGSSLSMTIPDGCYSGSKTATASDSNLTAENIKKDVEIFGVTGTYEAGPTCSDSTSTRWCDNNNGTVTDMTTGLIWLQKADWGGKKQWDGNNNAHVRAGILKAGTSGAELSDSSEEGDWRLPTKKELVGITIGTDRVSNNNMGAFSGVQTNYYWSSSIPAYRTPKVWCVSLSNGGVFSANKTNTFYVWPVRGGQ
jgi:hypothetical protein